jgi:hypothetical protein
MVMKAARKLKVIMKAIPKGKKWYWWLPAGSLQGARNRMQIKAKPSRGRPVGTTDPQVKKRRAQLLREWDQGKFGKNKSAAGRAHKFDRSDATKIINDHEKAKQREDSTN